MVRPRLRRATVLRLRLASDLIPTGGFDAAPVVIGSVLAMLLGAGVLLMVRLRHRSVSAE